MNVVIRKPDLDTCLTALIMGVCADDDVILRAENASQEELEDPAVLCIEAGGSGQVHLKNFDHHDSRLYLPPACQQALLYKKAANAALIRLADYVALVDEAKGQRIAFPSLSNLFSGMMLTHPDSRSRFFKGMEMLADVLAMNINPFLPMPDIEQWRRYRKAKVKQMETIEAELRDARVVISSSGLKIGFLESCVIGAGSRLYDAGCDVIVLFAPAFGFPPVPKYTIYSKEVPVISLTDIFNLIESGWGGREKIIGSPGNGTALNPDQALNIVIDNL